MGLFVLALCVLRVAGVELDFFHKAVVFGIWAVAVVYFYWTLSSRSFVYVWDYANYLLKQYDAEAAFAQSAGAGLAYIFGSMADDYTNFITLFTEFPFCLTSHTGDAYSFSQVFCILPTLLVLLAGLVVKVGQILNVKNRMYYFLFGMTLTAAYPFLRMSAVLAQPDWFGLIFAFAILLLTLDLRFDKLEPVRFGLIFLATAAIILALLCGGLLLRLRAAAHRGLCAVGEGRRKKRRPCSNQKPHPLRPRVRRGNGHPALADGVPHPRLQLRRPLLLL